MEKSARLAYRLCSRDLDGRRERAAGVDTADDRAERNGVLLPRRW